MNVRARPRLRLMGMHAPSAPFDICEPWVRHVFQSDADPREAARSDYPTISQLPAGDALATSMTN